MRRTSRLFEIIQLLRNQSRPITAEQIAAILEVSKRTVYRDIASLQAMRTPIEGEAGVGYIMRSGYDLPPLNFDTEELEAIVVGLSLLSRTGDSGLNKAAIRVCDKIDELRENGHNLHVSNWGAVTPENIDMSALRLAIRQQKKLDICYIDEKQQQSQRIILPIAMVYYIEVIVLAAWCELREDFRHFRVDRISHCVTTEANFNECGNKLREKWQASKLQKV